jgi:hypothetical protein
MIWKCLDAVVTWSAAWWLVTGSELRDLPKMGKSKNALTLPPKWMSSNLLMMFS